jgi:protein involved in polysaccharide export with SLBB domain
MIKRLWLMGLVVIPLLVNAYLLYAVENDYRLGSGDRIKVTVFRHKDLSGEFEVNSAGRIRLPLIQEVQAAGLTAQELEQAIADKLKPDYLKEPRVSVQVLTYRPFSF